MKYDITNTLKTYLILILSLLSLSLQAQPICEVDNFDELREVTSTTHRILQSQDGMIWMATSNGLYRYDGYTFDNFKTHVGDGINISSDYINKAIFNTHDDILCQIESKVLMFDTRKCDFIDILSDLEKAQNTTFKITKIKVPYNGTSWLVTDDYRYICIEDDAPESSAKVILQGIGKVNTIVAGIGHDTWLLGGHRTYIYSKNHLTFIPCGFASIANSSNKTWLVTQGGKLCYYDARSRCVKRYRANAVPTNIIEIQALTGNRLALITRTHLCILNPSDGSVECDNYTYQTKDIREDADGNLWILSREGYLLLFKNGKLSKRLNLSWLYHPYWFVAPTGMIWFINDNGDIYYLDKSKDQLIKHPSSTANLAQIRYFISDANGSIWISTHKGVYRLSFRNAHYTYMPQDVKESTKAFLADKNGNYWIAGKEKGDIRLFDANLQPLGYLCSNGTWQPSFVSFGATPYCIKQDTQGNIWLGCKPEGLYRLTPRGDGSYQVTHFAHLLNNNLIHDMTFDQQGQLWIATIEGGINCIPNPLDDTPQAYYVGRGLNGYSKDYTLRTTSLLVSHDNKLIVGSKEGLFIADLRPKDIRHIVFKRHQRECNRETSLSCSSINSIFEDSRHRIFIATESGGVNQIASSNLLDNQLDFIHYDQSNGGGTDCALRMFEDHGELWIIAPNKLIALHPNMGQAPESAYYLQHENLSFIDARPLHLANGSWFMGVTDGTIMVTPSKLKNQRKKNPLVITSVIINGLPTIYDTNYNDSIIMQPGKRDVTINFATLNYSSNKLINYAFKKDKDKEWTYLSTGHTITLSDLDPGSYQLYIRSTNGNGEWIDNTRTITIMVKPTFWQSAWGHITLFLIIILMLGASTYTYFYIHGIRQKHKMLLDAYLKLTNDAPQKKPTLSKEEQHQEVIAKAHISARDDAFMKKVLAFVEDHISDSDVNIDIMASELAISRTGMNRKIKQFFGITPVELLREARIRHACVLLKDSDKSINEVAFDCGFSDPKYFSKCFKNSIGKTPTEYRD